MVGEEAGKAIGEMVGKMFSELVGGEDGWDVGQ